MKAWLAVLILGPVLASPVSSQVVYVDARPYNIEAYARAEAGALGLRRILNAGFDSGAKFVQVPRRRLAAERRPTPPPPDSMEALYVELGTNLDDTDPVLAPIPYALARVLRQGRDHIGYDKLDADKAGLFTSDKEEDGGQVERRIFLNRGLGELAARGVGRWALASILVHEGRHELQDEAGDAGKDPLKDEVEAFSAQYKFLVRRRADLEQAARDSLARGDLVAMRFYSHLLEIVEFGDQGRLADLVRKNYSFL